MKAVLAQLNYHIGNFPDTITRLALEIKKAEEQGADLIIFSELAISGYPPLDLLEYSWFIEECDRAIHQLSTISNHVGILIGAPTVNPEKLGKKLYNSAYYLHEGKVKQLFHKTLLPTYDIFDEYRYFEPNKDFTVLEIQGYKIAVTICEDLWFEQPVDNAFSNSPLYSINPINELMKQEPDLVVNLAASPFSWSRQQVKMDIFRNNARKYRLPVLYVNQVGAQTELIFEGGSLVVNSKGEIVHALKMFQEDRYLVNLDELLADSLIPEPFKPMQGVALIYHGLIMGVRDYFHKLGFRKAILGLSGGIDSAVTLVIACQALGAENITVLLMPSQYSSDHSMKDAVKLADTLDVSYKILPIKNAFDAYLDALKPVFGDLPHDIAEENIQSRIRGTFLMAYSNKFGNILLNTSNKSEAAVGYGTLYGDMAGGLSVLGDVYKTDVYRIARFINADREIIPGNTLMKPPSAELKPNQKDTDSLPDYEILDNILHAYIEQQKPIEEIIREGNDPALTDQVIRMVNKNEYKRYQTPPILRISSKAFGAGRRMPVVAKY